MRSPRLLQPAILSIIFLLLISESTARPSIPHIEPIANHGKVETPTLTPRNPPPAWTTSFPLPDPDHYPLQFALDKGWSVAVNVFSYIYPTLSSTKTLEDFFTGIQAVALAKMLQGFSNPCRARFADGDLVLVLQMHPRSIVGTVEWSMVYAFARYMLKWVQRGFSGNGGLLFHHRSGVILGAVLLNRDSAGLPENTVQPDVCPD